MIQNSFMRWGLNWILCAKVIEPSPKTSTSHWLQIWVGAWPCYKKNLVCKIQRVKKHQPSTELLIYYTNKSLACLFCTKEDSGYRCFLASHSPCGNHFVFCVKNCPCMYSFLSIRLLCVSVTSKSSCGLSLPHY